MHHSGTGHQQQQKFEKSVLLREFRLELAELTEALREGLTAVGLKAAMAIAQQMLAAEVEAIAARTPQATAWGPNPVGECAVRW